RRRGTPARSRGSVRRPQRPVGFCCQRAELADGTWHAKFLGAKTDPYAPLLQRIMGESAQEASGNDMFALFARRERDLSARVFADLNGLLEMRGAQARCLECPRSGGASIAAGPAAFGDPWLRLLARLFD